MNLSSNLVYFLQVWKDKVHAASLAILIEKVSSQLEALEVVAQVQVWLLILGRSARNLWGQIMPLLRLGPHLGAKDLCILEDQLIQVVLGILVALPSR